MWLFTKYGFYSVTVSRDDPAKMQIRARAKKDLERLVDFAEKLGWKPGEHYSEILETKNADYRWRIICTPSQWAAIADGLAWDIDYSNFKNEIKDGFRHRLYEKIWHTMLELQHKENFEDRQQALFLDAANALKPDYDLDLLDDDGIDFRRSLEEEDDFIERGLDAVDFTEVDDNDPNSPFYDPGRFTGG